MYHMGWMNAAVLKKCDKCINDFVGAWMACEKIVGVPMVFPYTQMLSVFMVLFVYTFPFPLAHIFFNEDAEFNGFFITPFICARVYRIPLPSATAPHRCCHRRCRPRHLRCRLSWSDTSRVWNRFCPDSNLSCHVVSARARACSGGVCVLWCEKRLF